MSAEEARAYQAACWFPIPLPAGTKYPPPIELTGYRGRYLGPDDLGAYDWTGNMAVRLPPDVVGVDVDVYNGGDVTLKELEGLHGRLPPTVHSTSRIDGSAIGFYRVPVGTTLLTKPGKGIEMIQCFHRYAVCWPSVHPDTGQSYRWYGDAGELILLPPHPGELPDLPWGWILALGAIKGRPGRAVTPQVATEFIDSHAEALAPGALGGPFTRYGGASEGERHDSLIAMAPWLAREAAAGWYSAAEAFDRLKDWWEAAFEGPGREPDDGEFARAVLWAIAQTQTAEGQAEIAAKRDTAVAPPAEPIDDYQPGGQSSYTTFLSTRGGGQRIVGNLGMLPDGRGLLHLGRFNLIHGDSGAGKSWLLAYLVAEVIATRRRVAVLDYEDQAEVLGSRLRQIGVAQAAQDEWLRFAHPDEPATPAVVQNLVDVYRGDGVQHMFLDSWGEAFGHDGVDENSDPQVTAWITRVVRPLENAGIGATLLDHITKAADNVLYPSGTKRKRAALTGTNWYMYATEPYSLESGGKAVLRAAKDRHGQYRSGDNVAELVMSPLDVMTGRATLELRPIASAVVGARPDLLVSVVSICGARPTQAFTKTGLHGEARQLGIKFKDAHLDEAAEAAVLRGFLRHTTGYNGASAVIFVKPIPPDWGAVRFVHPAPPSPQPPSPTQPEGDQ